MRMVLVAVILGCGVCACGDDGAEPRTICHADAILGADGESYGRDPEQGCRWVDDEGRPLATYPDGSTICYRDGSVDFPCE